MSFESGVAGEVYYKVLLGDQSCHGGQQTWPLPTADGPGEWLRYDGRLVPCKAGFHVTVNPAKWYDRGGLIVYRVEVRGAVEACSDDKRVCSEVRLVRALTAAELEAFGIYTLGTHEVQSGFAVVSGSATVRACGSATVRASGSATVTAYGSATVRACDSATVRACGSATVTAYGSATVTVYDSATVTAYGSATVTAYDSATVTACDSATVRASDSATVTAYGSATVRAYDSATVRASGSATVRAYDSATVTAYDSATVTAYSPVQKVSLSGLAILHDRSRRGRVTVRCAPGAAVTLEEQPAATGGQSNQPQGA